MQVLARAQGRAPAAMAAQPAGGELPLTPLPFVVKWGSAATCARMATPPTTGMLQVNARTGNARVVRRDV